MADKRNPYDDLMDDDIKPVAKPRPVINVEKAPETEPEPSSDGAPATTIRTSPDSTGGEPKNPYDDLIDDEDKQAYKNTGATIPSTAAINSAVAFQNLAPSTAEEMAGATRGSVAEINALMSPKKTMTPEAAARAVMEAKNAPFQPKGGGQAWLHNWANIQDPEFTGGVPEAAQKYQRGKPQGKVTSKLYKKFGNMPLNIEGQLAQSQVAQQLSQQESQMLARQAAEIERQIQASANAYKYAKYLNTVAKGAGAVAGGLGAMDVYNRLKDKDTEGAIASGLGTAASLAPFAVGSAGVLPAVGAAMPLYLMAHDRIERLKRHPEEFKLQQDEFDPMGNPIR
jgi:hypothetical protein